LLLAGCEAQALEILAANAASFCERVCAFANALQATHGLGMPTDVSLALGGTNREILREPGLRNSRAAASGVGGGGGGVPPLLPQRTPRIPTVRLRRAARTDVTFRRASGPCSSLATRPVTHSPFALANLLPSLADQPLGTACSCGCAGTGRTKWASMATSFPTRLVMRVRLWHGLRSQRLRPRTALRRTTWLS
jgi:hypothetical protein